MSWPLNSADNLTTAQFNWRSQPGRWSIAECLVHLNISAKLFGQAIASAVNDARRAGVVGTGPFRYGPLSRWFLGFVEPDSKKRYKTPGKFAPEPSERFEVERVLEEFRAAGTRWEQCLREANGLDLARVKVRVASRTRCCVFSWVRCLRFRALTRNGTCGKPSASKQRSDFHLDPNGRPP